MFLFFELRSTTDLNKRSSSLLLLTNSDTFSVAILAAARLLAGKTTRVGWPDRRYLGKDEKEIEAEAVAFLVSCRAGVMTRSAEYLKIHAQKGRYCER